MSDLLPKGEAVRRAVRWISQHRIEEPDRPLAALIDEASRRFDLSPLQADGLLAILRGPAPDDGESGA